VPPTNTPELETASIIPDIGELMLAIFFSKAANIDNWWMGEKYDGIRACWNPNLQSFYSRQGKVLRLLHNHYKNMTSCFLDGELWFGRRNLSIAQQLSGSAQQQQQQRQHTLHNNHNNNKEENVHVNVKWQQICLLVFDCPTSVILSQKDFFEKRYSYLFVHIVQNHPFMSISSCIRCANKKYMQTYASMIIGNGGEGVILRKPSSLYEHGKSHSLLKFKAMIDMEACVVRVDGNKCTCILPGSKIIIALKKAFTCYQKWRCCIIIYYHHWQKTQHTKHKAKKPLFVQNCVCAQ